jgi:hypothetical protein
MEAEMPRRKSKMCPCKRPFPNFGRQGKDRSGPASRLLPGQHSVTWSQHQIGHSANRYWGSCKLNVEPKRAATQETTLTLIF